MILHCKKPNIKDERNWSFWFLASALHLLALYLSTANVNILGILQTWILSKRSFSCFSSIKTNLIYLQYITLALRFHVHFYLHHSRQVTLELRWCHNIPKYIWWHVMINKFRIPPNSLENGHSQTTSNL